MTKKKKNYVALPMGYCRAYGELALDSRIHGHAAVKYALCFPDISA
jgi:hypothetical protein